MLLKKEVGQGKKREQSDIFVMFGVGGIHNSSQTHFLIQLGPTLHSVVFL